MSAKSLLIIGTGSQARYVIDIALQSPKKKIAGLIDIKSPSNVGKKINGVPVVGLVSDVMKSYAARTHELVVAIGDGHRKKELVGLFQSSGYIFPSMVSAMASISPFSKIGAGCIINAGASVMPNADVGDHVILHSGCVVEHDNKIGNYVNLAPGVCLAGRVSIDEGATLYTGVNVIPDIHIGAWSVVGAGSTVTKPVAASSRVAGTPARPIAKGPR